MRAQVPEDIGIALYQPEIDSNRIVIKQVSELAGIHQLFHPANGGRVQKRVVHHERPTLALGELD